MPRLILILKAAVAAFDEPRHVVLQPPPEDEAKGPQHLEHRHDCFVAFTLQLSDGSSRSNSQRDDIQTWVSGCLGVRTEAYRTQTADTWLSRLNSCIFVPACPRP